MTSHRTIAFVFMLFLLMSTAPLPSWAKDSQPLRKGWSVTEEKGVKWLVTPEGSLFYSKGVNIVTPGTENEKSKLRQAYCWRNFYQSLDEWSSIVGKQLGQWGFNTRGGWSYPSPQIDLALTVDLELGRNAKFHWFDPFAPAMEEHVLERAKELTAPYKNDPKLLGYFSDNEVGWWNAPLFSWYLQAGWENYTKQELWRLLYRTYEGDWDKFLVDWVPEGQLSSFESLRNAGAQIKLRPGGNGIRVVDEFLYLYTKRYYQLMYKAIKTAHPEALVLGDRLPLYYHQDAVRAMGDSIDVISTNYNVDVPDGWVAPYYFEGLQRLSTKPVMVTEFFFAAEENRSGNRNETARNKYAKPGHLMTVQTQSERARGSSKAILNFAGFPNVVGAHWFQYADEPCGGREDGEDYNMGLIDTSNRPYEELTDVFSSINPTLEAVHRQGSDPDSSTGGRNGLQPEKQEVTAPSSIPRAFTPIDVKDQSLLDWDKAGTRLLGLRAPEPYVPFGDVHLAWRPEGLYLAGIANTYVDPKFLSYSGEFPLSESFQFQIAIEAGGKLYRFVIYLVPSPNADYPDGFEIRPQIVSMENGAAKRLPLEGHVQRIDKSLPHMMFEGFIPAQWIGMDVLEDETKLGMNVLLVSFYRELSVAWAGNTSLGTATLPDVMRTVFLKSSDKSEAKKNTGNPASGG